MMTERAAPNEEMRGEWITPQVSYIEPLRNACAFCGRPIARRYWRSDKRGPALMFCSPDHAHLYETYWVDVHGTGEPAGSGSRCPGPGCGTPDHHAGAPRAELYGENSSTDRNAGL